MLPSMAPAGPLPPIGVIVRCTLPSAPTSPLRLLIWPLIIGSKAMPVSFLSVASVR